LNRKARFIREFYPYVHMGSGRNRAFARELPPRVVAIAACAANAGILH